MSSGAGPPSASRLGSQEAVSRIGLPTHALFQSTSTARPSRRQRLSLRTSKCSTCVPVDPGRGGRGRERRQVARRATRASRVRARGRAAGSAATSGQPSRSELALVRGGHAFGARGRRMDRLEGGEDRVDARAVPRGRPRAPDRSSRASAERSPSSSQPRSRGRNGCPSSAVVHPALVAEPVRRVVERGDLHERRPAAGKVDHEPPGRRGAVPGRGTPGDRRRPEGTAHAFDVGGVGLHPPRLPVVTAERRR